MANGTEAYEFTEAEAEGLEFSEAEEGELEEEMLEDQLEEIEDVEMEGVEGQEAFPALAILGKSTVKYLLKVLMKIGRKLVIKMLNNATLRAKLKLACEKKLAGFTALLCPLICRQLPKWLRPICNRLCRIVCAKLYPWVCRKVGVHA